MGPLGLSSAFSKCDASIFRKSSRMTKTPVFISVHGAITLYGVREDWRPLGAPCTYPAGLIAEKKW